MRTWVVIAGVALAGPALAGDKVHKAGGYEVIVTGSGVDVRSGKRRATLIVAKSGTIDSAAKVDAKAKKITLTLEHECGERTDTFTFEQLEARLVNHESLVLHRKKDWAKAATGFETATKLDPSWNLPAFNLASAYARLGVVDKATAALAPWLKRDPVGSYVQIASDPELQPLLTTPQLTAIHATSPSGFTFDRKRSAVPPPPLVSTDKGLIAVVVPEPGYPSCDGPSSMQVHDLKTAAVVTTFTYLPCGPSAKQREARWAVLEKALSNLGFAAAEVEEAELRDADENGDKQKGRFAKAKLGVVTNQDGGINVLRGSTRVATVPSGPGRFSTVSYVPAVKFIYAQSYVPSDMCARYTVEATSVP